MAKTVDLDNYQPDIDPEELRALNETIKAMNVMMTMQHQDKDDPSRFWYAQVIDHIDPILLHIMLNTPKAHRLKVLLESIDNTQIVLISPYMYDMLREFEDSFKKELDAARNLNMDVLVGGKEG